MESRAKGKKRCSLKADAMRGRAAIPCNSHGELMPYQALRSWINKKTNRSSSFYFGGESFSKVEPLLIFGATDYPTKSCLEIMEGDFKLSSLM